MQSPPPTNSTLTHRGRRPVPTARWRVAVALFGVLTTMSLAQAVIPIPGADPGCPFGANCFPGPGATPLFDGMGSAADQSGADMHRRMNEGDCTGLGPAGCAALILHQVLCAIDGRAWVQEGCSGGTPPPSDGGGGDGGGGDGGDGDGGGAGGDGGGAGGDGPGGGAPKPDDAPQPSPQSGSANASAVVKHREMNTWLRRALTGHRGGPFESLKIGDSAYEVYVGSSYEFDPEIPTNYFAILVAVNTKTGEQTQLAMGAMGDTIYAATIEALRTAR